MECIHGEDPRRVLRAVVGRDVRVVERAPLSQWIFETSAGDVCGDAGLSWMERKGLKREAGNSECLLSLSLSLASSCSWSHPRSSPLEMIAAVPDETTDRERGRWHHIRG